MRSLLWHVVLVSSLLLPASLLGQVPPGWDAAAFQMSRQELEELLARYESVLESPGYSGALKEDARRSADLIRARLEDGDFKVGDRIVVQLQGPRTAILPDTLLVTAGPSLEIPDMGAIPLQGVLRSELEGHLTTELARYLRDPVLTARSLIRLSILGQVGQPGFYVFPSDMLLTDALMQAGISQSSDLEDTRIRRGEEELMDGAEVRTALNEGRSLDQLGLQAGDEIAVAQKPQRAWWPQALRIAAILASSVFLGVRLWF